MSAGLARRDMLRLLLGAASVALAPAGEAAPRADVIDGLLACFDHPESAAFIGRAYLKGLSEAPDGMRLVSEILQGWKGDATSGTFAPFVRRRLDADFARGALVRVDGWMLAETEAQLCALAALVSEPAPSA